MPRKSIPAPGFQTITGTRAPPKKLGTHLWCQIRGSGSTAGWVDVAPWPVETTRWKHDGSAGDVVAVRKVE